MVEFKLPELGENVETGEVLRVLVSPGDTIATDQPVVELETDKATVEVPSSVAGRVQDIKVKVGDKVKVGQVILTVEEAEAGEAAPKAGAAEAPPKAKEGAPKKDEAAPKKEQAPKKEETAPAKKDAKPEPAAAAGEQPAEEKVSDGLEQHVGAPPGAAPPKADGSAPKAGAGADEAPPPSFGTTTAVAEAERAARTEERGARNERGTRSEERAGEAERGPRPAPRAGRGEVVDISRGVRAAPEAPEPRDDREAAPAAPSVRRLARELGVDVNEVPGSGPAGRISEDDVKAYARHLIAQTGERAAGGARVAEPLPDFTVWGEVERKSMSGVRRKTAEHLSHAWNVIPHVTQYDKADIGGIEQMRERFAKRAAADAPRLTVTAFAIKVAARAIQVFPQFNASADMAAEEIVYKKYVHIGVAVDTDRGLLVPVIRDADKKTVGEITAELAELAERARNRKLTRDEMQGGSFTITNLGGFGGTYFSPIVNWPEVAILGLSRAVPEPVFVNGVLQPRLMLPLSLSYDHRVIDGADAVRFLRWVAEVLEQPYTLELGT